MKTTVQTYYVLIKKLKANTQTFWTLISKCISVEVCSGVGEMLWLSISEN